MITIEIALSSLNRMDESVLYILPSLACCITLSMNPVHTLRGKVKGREREFVKRRTRLHLQDTRTHVIMIDLHCRLIVAQHLSSFVKSWVRVYELT